MKINETAIICDRNVLKITRKGKIDAEVEIMMVQHVLFYQSINDKIDQ